VEYLARRQSKTGGIGTVDSLLRSGARLPLSMTKSDLRATS
jgi:hypothetical protein